MHLFENGVIVQSSKLVKTMTLLQIVKHCHL